jgi:type VI secretion system protein ImpA
MNGRWDSQLLEPITAEQPCGQNLEDTQLLASFDAFRLFGQAMPLIAVEKKVENGLTIEDARSTPPWPDICDAAVAALGQSKDLRLLAYLGAAVLRTDGLPEFASVLGAAARWLDDFWPQVFPLVDEDIVFRRSALSLFADQMAVVDGLRRARLVSSRQHGQFSMREIEPFLAAGAPHQLRPEGAAIEAAFKEMPLAPLTALQESTAAALQATRRIDAKMRETAGEVGAPGLEPLQAQLTKIDRFLKGRIAARPEGAGAGVLADGEQAGGAGQPSAPATGGVAVQAVGAIHSRQDAIRALDAVAEFFRKNEPSSPVPLFAERAKRLIAKNFLEVLADVAPEGLAAARSAGGVTTE